MHPDRADYCFDGDIQIVARRGVVALKDGRAQISRRLRCQNRRAPHIRVRSSSSMGTSSNMKNPSHSCSAFTASGKALNAARAWSRRRASRQLRPPQMRRASEWSDSLIGEALQLRTKGRATRDATIGRRGTAGQEPAL